MNIRKIAVVGSFAAGAALALAPIASADDLTAVLDGARFVVELHLHGRNRPRG